MNNPYKTLMRVTGSNDGNPPEAKTLHFNSKFGTEEIIASNNDGFEMWLGYPDQWKTHYRAEDVAKITRWLIVEWYIRARWLGLRRPIYYWALRRYLAALRSKGLVA